MDLSHLVALSITLEGDIDPLALAGEEGWLIMSTTHAVAAMGVAATIDLPNGLAGATDAAVAASLASIAHHDGADIGAAGLRAFGALPFNPNEPCAVVVPALLVQRRPDGTWVATSIAEEDTWPSVVAPSESVAAATASPTVRSAIARPTPNGYEEAVAAATMAMENGEVSKVVLGRRLTVQLDRPLPLVPALSRLRAREPLCTIYAVPTSSGRFFGASPELIVDKHGTAVRSHPLAGSVAIDGTDADELAARALEASEKNQREHQLVFEDIVWRLSPLCQSVAAAPQPSLMVLASIAHLGTTIDGTVERGPNAPDALALAAAIAPTPAVGGVPIDRALELIDELEHFDRGVWAGIIGTVDAAGDGTFVLGIRGAHATGSTLTLHAGCGIVAASDPAEELAETTVKLRAVLDVIVPGAAEHLRGALSGQSGA